MIWCIITKYCHGERASAAHMCIKFISLRCVVYRATTAQTINHWRQGIYNCLPLYWRGNWKTALDGTSFWSRYMFCGTSKVGDGEKSITWRATNEIHVQNDRQNVLVAAASPYKFSNTHPSIHRLWWNKVIFDCVRFIVWLRNGFFVSIRFEIFPMYSVSSAADVWCFLHIEGIYWGFEGRSVIKASNISEGTKSFSVNRLNVFFLHFIITITNAQIDWKHTSIFYRGGGFSSILITLWQIWI